MADTQENGTAPEPVDPRTLSAAMLDPARLKHQISARIAHPDMKCISPDDLPAILSALGQPPEPVESSAWETATDPGAREWFSAALPALKEACLGLDLAQITSEGAVQERFPLRLLSPEAWLLRLRYPLGPAIRTAEFIVDLNTPDGAPVIPLSGRSQEFHDRLSAYSVASCGDACSVADFARIFCTYLEAQHGMFLPCESGDDLRSRFLGRPDVALIESIKPWCRLTPAGGAALQRVEAHIFHGPMLYGQYAFLMSLIVALPLAGVENPPDVAIYMFDDLELSPDKLPMVPARRDALTHAFYPLRSGR